MEEVEIITQESTENRQVTRRRGWLVALVSVIVVAGVAAIAWGAVASGGDPVAASDARIEMTYTDDGTSFVGDRVIIEGAVTITFTNESDAPVTWSIWGYETGSEALVEELAFLEEGEKGVPTTPMPVAGFYVIDLEYPDDIGEPGTRTWTLDLASGTWIFDVGPEDFRTTGLWRAAVIEVVSK